MDFKKEIKKLKKQIDALRPLTRSEILELKKWYDVTYTYHSNAIEGNTLTLAETKVVIEDGLTVGGHPLREIFEAKNHKEAIDYLFNVVKRKKDLSERMILKMHKILIKEIDNENAGKYRKIQVYITGEEKKLPKAEKVPELMKKFFEWYAKNKNKNSVDLAGELHYRFVKIHPFVDGNGRMARLISNLILLQGGHPLVIIPIVRRMDYINSLKSSANKKVFMEFFYEMVYENMRDYLRMIK